MIKTDLKSAELKDSNGTIYKARIEQTKITARPPTLTLLENQPHELKAQEVPAVEKSEAPF
jgi:hypothetical protein